MNIDLAGRHALVTGASRGIGRSIAVALGRCGAAVIVNFNRSEAAADEAVAAIEAAGGRAWAVQADVAIKTEVDRLFDTIRHHFGDRLDILVNNAGTLGGRYSIAQMPEDAWDHCMAVNVKSAFLCTQAAYHLLPDGKGRIVNVTSISARTGGGPCAAHYAAAKGALSSFTRNCARELAPRRITVNAVAPGLIKTDMHNDTPANEFEQATGRIPLGYAGSPDDIVGAVLYLCDPQASYVHGEIIEINGGMLMS